MSEEERKDVANIISSILTSTTKRMTIKQLDTDFLNTVGYKIPFRNFGCNSLEQFLWTLKDKVQVCGYGINAEVQVVISDKTAHINDLISKQRTPKQKPPRFSYNKQLFNRRNFSCYTNKHNPQTSIVNESINNQILIKKPKVSSKGAVPKQLSQGINEVDEIFFSDEESAQNMKVPPHIQDNLRKLIMKCPNGILCFNILEAYRKEYGVILSYNDYGYRSVAQMCVDLRNIFNIVQIDKSDIKLFDKNIPIPKDTLNIVKKLQLMKIKASIEAPTENAIPQVDAEELMSEIYNEKTPEDVVQFGVNLEKQWIDPGTNEQDYIDVNVGEVYDPSKFWINLKVYCNKLNTLMDNMQVFYAIHKQELLVPYLALRKDMYIACIFDREYHRARVVDTSQKHEQVLKVYFVDYGTVSVISIDGVCYLHNQFSELPEQAIRARLAGIYPPLKNGQWSRAAASRFLSLVKQKDLVAQLIKIDEERKVLDIVLADTSEEDEDFFINDALVNMGYALFTFQEQAESEIGDIVPIVRYIHLFPTHTELESGLVPSAVQMISMHYAGLIIEQIYPHYFKDSKTNLSISLLQTSSNRIDHLPIDHEMEQPYYEENTKTETQYVSSDLDVSASSSKVENHWEDIIEQNIPNDETIDEKVENCIAKENISNNDKIDEDEQNSVKESYEIESRQIINNSASAQTDKSTSSRVESIITNSTNIENTPIQDRINNSACTQTNERGNITNIAPDTMKKPLRPPPGYNNINPHNMTVNYNYGPFSGPSNYVASQTYINFPGSFYPAIPPQPYLTYEPPHDQYSYGKIMMEYIQLLVHNGAILTPELQNILQSVNRGGVQYPMNEGNVNCGMQTNHPSNIATNYLSEQNFRNMESMQDYQYEQFPHAKTESQNCYTANICSNNYYRYQENVSAVTSQSTPINDLTEHVTLNTSQNVDQGVQVDMKSNHLETASHVQNEKSNTTEKHINSPNDNKLLENEMIPADKSQDLDNIESQDGNIKTLSVKIDNVNKLTTKNETQGIPGIDSNNQECIGILNEVSEIESVYEECLSNEIMVNDNNEKHTTILEKNISYETKFIKLIDIGKLRLHIVNLDSDSYILLTELSKKIFGKSLTVLQIRKLSIGTPYIISVVDIRLNANPDLKKELLMYDLITEKELTVDAVPVKYLKELTKIISVAEDQIDCIKDLLKEVDLFL